VLTRALVEMEVLFIVSRRMERNILVGEPGNRKKSNPSACIARRL